MISEGVIVLVRECHKNESKTITIIPNCNIKILIYINGYLGKDFSYWTVH